MNESQRFESHITHEPNTGCWLWTASATNGGYGFFSVKRKTMLAHRYSFARAGGVLVDGLVLDHICRVRSCVNPAHLRQVTQKENVCAPGAPGSRTHCKRGHIYVGDVGDRTCETCHSEMRAARRAADEAKFREGNLRRSLKAYAKNPELHRERRRRYSKEALADPARRERINAYQRAWRARQKDGGQ